MSEALPFNPAKEVGQMFEKASSRAVFDEQILSHTKQNLAKISEEEFSSEQQKELQLQFPLVITQLKFFVLQLKQAKTIDSKLAGLLSAALKDFDIAREQNSITKERQEKLESVLSLAKQKFRELLSSKKIDPLIAKLLIPLLSILSDYVKTMSIT